MVLSQDSFPHCISTVGLRSRCSLLHKELVMTAKICNRAKRGNWKFEARAADSRSSSGSGGLGITSRFMKKYWIIFTLGLVFPVWPYIAEFLVLFFWLHMSFWAFCMVSVACEGSFRIGFPIRKAWEDGQKTTLVDWRYATEWAGDKTQPCVLENKLYNSVTKNHIAYEVAMTLLSTHLWTGRCNRYWCLESEKNRSSHEP